MAACLPPVPSAYVVLVEDAPEIEFRAGLFYICDPSGTVRAMRPHVMLRGFHRCAKAIQDYHAATGAEVVQFPAAAHG